jgi:hypothetical protein
MSVVFTNTNTIFRVFQETWWGMKIFIRKHVLYIRLWLMEKSHEVRLIVALRIKMKCCETIRIKFR